jgi:hypothetical protein
MIQMVLTVGAHWSPLELEIEKRDSVELILMVLTIRAQWSWRLGREASAIAESQPLFKSQSYTSCTPGISETHKQVSVSTTFDQSFPRLAVLVPTATLTLLSLNNF